MRLDFNLIPSVLFLKTQEYHILSHNNHSLKLLYEVWHSSDNKVIASKSQNIYLIMFFILQKFHKVSSLTLGLL